MDRRLKVLVVQDMDWLSSLPLASHHLFEFLSVNKCDVSVIDYKSNIKLLRKPSVTKYERFLINERWRKGSRIQLIRLPRIGNKLIGRLASFIMSWPFLAREIYGADVTVLYSVPTYGLQVVVISKLLKKPVVFHSFDVINKFVLSPSIGSFVKALEKLIFRTCKAVVAITPSLAKYAISLGAKKKTVKIIPNGVDLSRFSQSKIKSSEILEKRGLTGKKIVLYTGWLYTFCGLDYLLSKHIRFFERNKIVFVIAGEGEISNTIREFESKTPSVVFLGRVNFDEIAGLIQGSKICINPFMKDERSLKAFPNKILEYMACGKPSLVTPLPGTVEVLGRNSGVVYADLPNFHATLVSLINDPARLTILGDQARLAAQKYFNLQRNSLSFFSILTSFCN
jgi:glycosyltransferase involved in cell wall biosynthesis